MRPACSTKNRGAHRSRRQRKRCSRHKRRRRRQCAGSSARPQGALPRPSRRRAALTLGRGCTARAPGAMVLSTWKKSPAGGCRSQKAGQSVERRLQVGWRNAHAGFASARRGACAMIAHTARTHQAAWPGPAKNYTVHYGTCKSLTTLANARCCAAHRCRRRCFAGEIRLVGSASLVAAAEHRLPSAKHPSTIDHA